MMDASLENALNTLASDLARPLDVHDAGSVGELKQSYLQQRVLGAYRDQLAGLGEQQTLLWLIDRVASLEARVMALQMAALQGHTGSASPITPPAEGADEHFTSPPEPAVEALPDRVLVLCDETMSQRGFYDVEHDIDGRAFRWLGPDLQATLFLPRVKSPFEIRLFIYRAFVDASIEQTKFSIDGGEWLQAIRDGDGETIVLRGRSQDGQSSEHPHVRIDIDAGINESPSDHGQDDTRRLSFAISRVELTPIAE